MKSSSIETILSKLNSAKVRYMVAGGIAVVAHGHVRFTADLDLILALDEANLNLATKVLASLGYRPRAPVSIEQFANRERRQQWIAEKGMTVFSLWSTEYPQTEIDLFVEYPLTDFETAFSRTVDKEFSSGVTATIIGLEDLIALKKKAGRTKDLEDIERLKALNEMND
jgi:hypothetical protein